MFQRELDAIGKRIEELRKSKGWTQEEFANLLGLTDVPATHFTNREASERYGLSEEALKVLDDMASLESQDVKEVRPYHDVINLLLTEPLGRKILSNLAVYFFAEFNAPENEGSIATYSMRCENGEKVYYQIPALTEEVFLNSILLQIMHDLRALWEKVQGSQRK